MSETTSFPKLFGPYVLARPLSADPLGESFRAGTVAGKNLKPFLLIKTFNGPSIDRDALLPAMETAVEFIEEVKGPAVAKGAVLGVVDDTPFAGIEYVAGRTLDLVFTGPNQEPVPIPVEHALLITEKLLIALEAAKAIAKGTGAPHGFLVPAFVAVSNDGDTRVFGAGLGSGLLPSLKHATARAAFAPYIAPEVLTSGRPSAAGDVYSAAAILFEALTGKPVAQGTGVDALGSAVLAVNGNQIPDDIKKLLARGLAADAARRESDVVAYRKELGKLLYGGPYAPSTFNLAFFMHNQFEKAIEKERRELAAEEQFDPKALLLAEEEAARPKAPASAPEPRKPVDVTIPRFGMDTGVGRTLGGTPIAKKPGLGGIPVPAVVAGVVVLSALGAFVFLGGGKKPQPKPLEAPPTPAPTAVPTHAPPPTPILVGKEDPAFQKALADKLAEEEKKLLDRISKEQLAAGKKRQADLDRANDEARKAKEAEDAARAARDRADQEEATRLAKEAAEARERESDARKAAEAALPKTKEGEIVDPSVLDVQPRTVKVVKPERSPMAIQRKVSGTVLMRVLVDENGKAAKMEVVHDTVPSVGLPEMCIRALKQWEWSPPMKDGKRVKTWVVVPLPFQ